MSSSNRFAFRHDVIVDSVRDCLANLETMSVLDCGCGNGEMPRVLENGGLDVGRIRYFGLDQDNRHVLAVRAQYAGGAFGKFEHFDVKEREIGDLAGYHESSFDLIVLSNVVHEIPTERFPRILIELNDLLRPNGVLLIVDMEELPPEEVEPWAIPFTLGELVKILRAGGWSPDGSTHWKSVRAYKLLFKPTANVYEPALIGALRSVLDIKRRQLISRLDNARSAQEMSSDMQRLACRLVAVILSTRQLKEMGN